MSGRRRRGGRCALDLLQDLRRDLLLALALRILLAPQERSAATARLQHHRRRAAVRTRHVHLLFRLLLRRREHLLDLLLQFLRQRLGTATLRIRTATQERAAEAALNLHRCAALLAVDSRLNLLLRVAVLIDVLGVLALRISAARQKRTALALAQHHRLAALVADVLCRPRRKHGLALGVEVHRGFAVGITRAAEELAALPHPLQHRLAAYRTRNVRLHRRNAAFLRLDVLALGVARAADELMTLTLARILDDQRFAALRAALARWHARRLLHLRRRLLQVLAE